jgi:hypothetical protein
MHLSSNSLPRSNHQQQTHPHFYSPALAYLRHTHAPLVELIHGALVAGVVAERGAGGEQEVASRRVAGAQRHQPVNQCLHTLTHLETKVAGIQT